jgi:hypothetical protein
MPSSARERVTAALLDAHEAPDLKAVMEDLLLRRFAPVEDATFQLFLDWQRAAEAAGYPTLR